MNDKGERTYGWPTRADLIRMRKAATTRWLNSIRRNHR